MRMRMTGVIIAGAMLLASCDGSDNQGPAAPLPGPGMPEPPVLDVDDNGYSQFDATTLSARLAELPLGTINDAEFAGMLLMREEEKFAGDVYTTLFDIHGLMTFARISEAEQTHAEAMRLLLDRYDIADPAEGLGVGEFMNQELQGLYDYLVAVGETTLLDALYVGAEIEELDIADLTRLEQEIDANEDIALVYANLKRGSRNHLRAFYDRILDAGGSYTPQYISQTEFDDIVNSDVERGP